MGLPDSRDVTFTPNSVPEIPAATLNALQDTAVLLFEQTARTPPRCAIRSYDGSKIRVEYVRSAWVIDSITSKWACVFQDEPGVDVTVAALAPAAMSFAANTWYYLYLRAASGLPTYVISTTAPGVGRIYKGTDKTYRLLKSFRTNGTGAIIPFSMVDGDSIYTGGNFLELNFDLTVNSTSWTPVGTDTSRPRFAPAPSAPTSATPRPPPRRRCSCCRATWWQQSSLRAAPGSSCLCLKPQAGHLLPK